MALRTAVAACIAACCVAAGHAAESGDFERALYKTRYEHEIQFRAAAIQVAWAAEPLCDSTTEVEPFVLWSSHALKKSLSARELGWLKDATGMDDRWRVAWLDESAPDALSVGDIVTALNGRPLPGGSPRLDPSQIFKGGSVVASDDAAFWDVMIKARDEATDGKPMTLTLADGRTLKADTQTGCAGSVTASAFDADPDQFWRSGATRVKIPANALLEARTRDEFRWLAAFGTYFQASEQAIGRARDADLASKGFVVGRILLFTVPGAGLLLTAAEAQTERALVVDGNVGSADLFANEVVAALGGDPAAGLRLSERLATNNSKVDAVLMSEFRRSNAAEHARRLGALREAAEQAAADAERADRESQLPAAPLATTTR